MKENRFERTLGVIKEVLTVKRALPLIEEESIQEKPLRKIGRFLNVGINYLRVSPQLHIPNFALTAAALAVSRIEMPGSEQWVATSVALAGIMACKAAVNLDKYLRAHYVLTTEGWETPLTTSVVEETLSGRNAFWLAATDTGMGTYASLLFERKGMNRILP